MPLECTFCTKHAEAVCHHCGNPLCNEHCIYITYDPAFLGFSEGLKNILIQFIKRSLSYIITFIPFWKRQLTGNPDGICHCLACAKANHLHILQW